MRTRITAGVVVAAAGLSVLVGGAAPRAGAQDKAKLEPPRHLYGQDLKVRNGGKTDFGPDTPRIGVEVFLDDTTRTIIFLSETGALAVTKAPTGGALGADRKCEWKTAHDLSVRKAGEAEFSQKTKKWGVELFQDRATNQLLYVCESGSVMLAPVPPGLVTSAGPKWHHALEAKVRAPEQESFDTAKRFGLEVFKDENTGGLIYITDVGAIAGATTALPAPDPKKPVPAPKALYGLDLRVRGAEEDNFTDKTRRIGVEVFEDPSTGVLFYLTDAGYIATAPGGKLVPKATGVTWKSAMALRARKGGEKDFDKAKKYGIEVFEDNRTGNLIFLCETGAIAVLPK
jgi:hypothetical protein